MITAEFTVKGTRQFGERLDTSVTISCAKHHDVPGGIVLQGSIEGMLRAHGIESISRTTMGFADEHKITLFTDDPMIKAHERWHLALRRLGFSLGDSLIFRHLEEAMAKAIGYAAVDRDASDIEDISRRLVLYAADTLDFLDLGMVPDYHKGKLHDVLSYTRQKTEDINWAAFLAEYTYNGYFEICNKAIRTFGLRKAKRYFIEALDLVWENRNLDMGVHYLANLVDMGDFFIPDFHSHPLDQIKTHAHNGLSVKVRSAYEAVADLVMEETRTTIHSKL